MPVFQQEEHPGPPSRVGIAEKFLDGRILKCLGEQRVAQKATEIPLAGESLEGGVVDDDGAGNGLAGGRVDGGLAGGFGLDGDELGECEAGGLSKGVEGSQPSGGQGRFDRRF